MSGNDGITYRRVGTMTYEATRDGVTVLVWRTHRGWSSKHADGTPASVDYPGSRAVAAGFALGSSATGRQGKG